MMAVNEKNKPSINKANSCGSVELSEALVLTRTRAADLESVKKLNCWASNIGDVNVVRRMPNLEVCSLSINKITTLRDFAHCYKLKELYVRTNRIERLSDIHYLQNLRRLRSLWLSENPCATSDNYRMTVLRTLPHLRKLDNVVVTEDEIQKAETEGDIIPIPDDFSYSSMFDIEALANSRLESVASELSSSATASNLKSDGLADVGESLTGVEDSLASVTDSASCVGDSVNSVSTSSGGWPLSRRRRLQRKREEMGRNSGEDASRSGGEGEVSPRSEEEGGENSVGEDVNSDSHAVEEDRLTGTNSGADESKEVKPEMDDSLPSVNSDCVSQSDSQVNLKVVKVTENSESTSASVEEKSVNSGESVSNEVASSRDDENDFGDVSRTSIDGMQDQSGHSTLVMETKSQEDSNCIKESSNNNDTLNSKQSVGITNIMNSMMSDRSITSNNENNSNLSLQSSSVDAEASTLSHGHPDSKDKSYVTAENIGQRSLLDQIRLDDSLDVMDSQTDFDANKNGAGVVSIELEDLDIEINEVQNTLSKRAAKNNSVISGKEAWLSSSETNSGTSTIESTRGNIIKPPVPTKPKKVNMDELNRMRAELGVKPLEKTVSDTPATNMEVTRARNSNILQAVLSLLKELDKDSLDIVGAAVKARVENLDLQG